MGNLMTHPSIIISSKTIFEGDYSLSHNVIIGYKHGKSEHPTILGKDIKIGSFTVIEDDVRIGHSSYVDHYCAVNSGTRIGVNSRILYGAKIHSNCQIGNNCIIGGDIPERIVIENDVTFLGAIAHSYRNATYDWDEVDEPSPTIKEGSVIGLNALIIGGINIGSNCYVGAGEILRHDLPNNSVYLHGRVHQIVQFRGLIKIRFK
jgi:UDP-2-acetamido-3-amino-2,3-dideoxy-glucuronate N-acetyltransferase